MTQLSCSPRGRRTEALVRRALGVLRVACVLGVLGAASMGWLVRAAAAQGAEALTSAGAALLGALPRADYATAPRRVSINGVTLRVVTASVPGTVASALAEVESRCRAVSGVDGEAELLRGATQVAPAIPAALLPTSVQRFESEQEGFVACLDTRGALSPQRLAAGLARVVETGDLSALGELRYAFARRAAFGVDVLLVWSEGNAPVLKMFPAEGDAPGADPPGFPRPGGLRRVLSAAERGTPYAVTLYSAPASRRAELVAFYREELSRRGLSVRELPSSSSRATGDRFVVRGARGDSALVHVGESRDGRVPVSLHTHG